MSEDKNYVKIEKEQISSEALDQIFENFILREGTDYGHKDLSFDTKKENLNRMLLKNQIVIVYDNETESVTLLSKEEFNRLK